MGREDGTWKRQTCCPCSLETLWQMDPLDSSMSCLIGQAGQLPAVPASRPTSLCPAINQPAQQQPSQQTEPRSQFQGGAAQHLGATRRDLTDCDTLQTRDTDDASTR
jgi:hypothetical protein